MGNRRLATRWLSAGICLGLAACAEEGSGVQGLVSADIVASPSDTVEDTGAGTDPMDGTDGVSSTDGTGGPGTDGTDGTGTTAGTDGSDTTDGTDSTDVGTDGTDGLEAWTLAVLPDTQYYAEDFPWVFDAQTAWLAENAEAMNIRFVVHEGDVTNHNSDLQWANARASMDTLNAAGLPYAIAPGNHDYGPGGSAADRSTLFNDYFSVGDYAASDGVMLYEDGAIDSSAHLLTAGGRDYLIVALEFAPRDDVIAWADALVAAHPGRDVIIVTHVYLYYDDTRYDWSTFGPSQQWSPYSYGLAAGGGINDGEQIWQKLAARHPNVRLVLNGHVLGDGAGHLASKGNEGNVVHQVLANYQHGVVPALPDGGGGYLRLITFEADGVTVSVETYSPYLEQAHPDEDQHLTLSLDPTDYDHLADCSPGRVAICSCPGGESGVRQCSANGTFPECVCDGVAAWSALRIEDDPDNATLSPCDGGSIKSPGADIDAAELQSASGADLALLTTCALSASSACENTNADVSQAEGAPDAPGTEAGGGYTSLNGGVLECTWTGGTLVQKGAGQVLVIHEIGQSIENYRVSLCNGDTCSAVSSYGTGVQTLPVDLLF